MMVIIENLLIGIVTTLSVNSTDTYKSIESNNIYEQVFVKNACPRVKKQTSRAMNIKIY
jgi:hypothetical protein